MACAILHQEMPLPLLWQRLNCAPRFRDVQPSLDTYPADQTVSLSGDLQAIPGPVPAPVGGRQSQFGVYVGCEGTRLTITGQTSLAFFSREAASGLVRHMKSTLERLLDVRSEDVVGDLEKPDTVGRYEEALLAQEEMGEYVVLEAGLIPNLR